MIAPKRILVTVTEQWQLIEAILKRFGTGDFSFHDIQTILKQQQPSWPSEKVFKEVNKLVQLEIVIPLAKSTQLELNRALLEFAQYLLQEESLGLAQEIQVLVSDLARLGERLYQTGFDGDSYELSRNARVMDERVRKVVKLFLHNQNAIYNLVEDAKNSDAQLTLAKRYQAVIEAFDHYIEPMLAMVDIGGEFKQCFERIEQQISEIIEHIDTLGKMNTNKRQLEQLRTRILDMYQVGQQSLTKSADILLPLREELRRNTLLTRQVSQVLALVRKKGVENVLLPFSPTIRSEGQKFSLGSASQMTAYMAELAHYEDDEFIMPNGDESAGYAPSNVPAYRDVKTAYLNKLRQDNNEKLDILSFINEQYQSLEADELLYLYQQLANDEHIQLSQQDTPVAVDLNNARIVLYPYQGQSSAK